MATGAIQISFRVWLPGGSFRWSDQALDGWVRTGNRSGRAEPPWLLRDPSPEVDASLEGGRTVDRSSARLYRNFVGLANRSRGTKAAFGDAVVRFADRYGFLGAPFVLSRPLPDAAEPVPGSEGQIKLVNAQGLAVHGVEAEPLEFWLREARAFYELDTLAELLRTKDIYGLSKRIEWDGQSQEVVYVHVGKFRRTRKPIAAKDRHPVRYERLGATQSFDRAWTYLSSELNRRLQTPLRVQVPSDPKRLATAHPQTLLDALYLRLYQKAARIESEVHCAWCGEPLPPESTARRTYCDDSCRMKFHTRARGITQAQGQESTAS